MDNVRKSLGIFNLFTNYYIYTVGVKYVNNKTGYIEFFNVLKKFTTTRLLLAVAGCPVQLTSSDLNV